MENEIDKISVFVRNLFKNHPHAELLYHNLDHTVHVVQRTADIADSYFLNEQEKFALLAAAWFHDCGHLIGDTALHEENSVRIMREYFSCKPIDEAIIAKIEACILATKMPVSPNNLLEKIICDADTFHLGTPDFFNFDQKVWDETELKTGKPIPPKHRIEKSIAFLSKHCFFTSFCKSRLLTEKEKNLFILQSVNKKNLPPYL